MIVLNGQNEIDENVRTKVVIGKFDGVHAGHKKLISEITKPVDGFKSLVFTFSFASKAIVDEKDRIMSKEEQYRIFEELNVDYLVVFDLTEDMAKMEPEDFARNILVKNLHCGEIVCGPDLSFGYKGRGNVALLKEMEKELNIKVTIIDKVQYKGEDISSSRIRKALNDGDFYNADKMLGR